MPDAVDDALAQARAAHPGLTVDEAAFRARATAALADAPGARLHAADLYLACACADGAPAAHAALERDVIAEVPRFVDRFRGGPAFADEVAQQVRERLLVGPPPRIAEYAGVGPLRAWVRVAASRIAIDLLRARGALAADELDEAAVVDTAARPDLEALRSRFRGHFQSALDGAITALTPRQRNLLRLHHVDGVSLDKLATIHRVHRATVARWLADARDEIATRTHEQLRDDLALASSEFASVIALVRSELHISITRLFGAARAP